MDSDLLELIIFGAVILFSVLSSLFKKKQPGNDQSGSFPGNQFPQSEQRNNQWDTQSSQPASSNDILREIESLFKQSESQSGGYESSIGYESKSYDETTSSMDSEETEYEGSTKNYSKSNYRKSNYEEGHYRDFSYKDAGYKDQHYTDFENTVKKSSYELSQEDLAEIERQKKLAEKYATAESDSVHAPYEAAPTSTTAGGSSYRVRELVVKLKDGKSLRDAVILSEILNRPKMGRRHRWT